MGGCSLEDRYVDKLHLPGGTYLWYPGTYQIVRHVSVPPPVIARPPRSLC
jgi:hypothetical protein